jgi:hypothetical protein
VERRLTDDELASAIGFCERGLIERPLLALRTSLGDDMSKALLGVLVELADGRRKLAQWEAIAERDQGKPITAERRR